MVIEKVNIDKIKALSDADLIAWGSRFSKAALSDSVRKEKTLTEREQNLFKAIKKELNDRLDAFFEPNK